MTRTMNRFDDQLRAALKRAYVAAYRWLRDPAAAEDALQEAAAKALQARDRYDASRPFYPWFHRILRNHCINVVAKRKPVMPADALVDPAAGAEAALARNDREQAVARAIAGLPEAHRQIIELRHYHDLSYQELADVLGCAEGTVMSRLYRARKALRAALLEHPDFGEMG